MSTEEPQTTSDPLRPHVRTFKPSGFQASEFEVVAAGTIATEFSPQQFAIVEGAPRMVDPMFDVYDNLVTIEQDFEEEEISIESSSFVEDREVTASDVEEAGVTLDESSAKDLAGNMDVANEGEESALEAGEEKADREEPVVLASEVELLHQKFEEELLAVQAEHERHLEEIKVALQQELSAQYAAESEDKVKAVEERYRTIIDDMSGQIRQEVEAVERRAVEFAIQVARKLVGTIVEINPEYILQVIQEAVKLTGGATIKAIRVSPQDLEFIKMLSPERQFKEFDGSWSFQSDDTIRAGCVLETSSGEVEFDLDKTWERIKESVTKVR